MPAHITEIEIFRLEQRYTRRKNRSGFVSDAQYVDGEYVYNSGTTGITRAAGKGGGVGTTGDTREGRGR